VWVSAIGADEGYITYYANALPKEGRWSPHDIWVRDFVSLSGDAYLGLLEHLLTHDLAVRVSLERPIDDPFADLCEDPWKVQVMRAEGAMVRIVDVERALAMRPYRGDRNVSFTMRIADKSAPWNEGVWRVEAAEGRMTAERSHAEPDVELTANTLSPLFTGFMRPDVALGVGLLKVNREDVIEEMTLAFAVTYPPFSNDSY
jgi:predicted acetyltransferase